MRYLVVYNGILFKMLDCDIAKSDGGSGASVFGKYIPRGEA